MPAEVLNETRCHLGEGPTYDPLQDKAWWFDIREKKLFEHDFGTGQATVHTLPCMGSMLGVIDERRQIVATEHGLYLRDTATGGLTLHQPIEADNPATRSNDGRVHPSGALWIGTMGKDAEDGAGAIYWFFRGELRKIFPAISIPNSMCFSPDGATGYFTDTSMGKLMTVPVDPASGLPFGEARVLYDHGAREGGLDGAVVDADGAIWVALWGGSSVAVISPQGAVLRSLPVPTLQPSCPAFIGRDLGRLLVTSAWQHMDDAQRAEDSQAGKTFILDAAVRGKPEPRVVL
jgi:sugar lactone lactonase YvrE